MLLQALARVAPPQRAVLVLRYWEEACPSRMSQRYPNALPGR